MEFIVKELYIVDEPNGVMFNGQLFDYSFAVENSLQNIFDEWKFDFKKSNILSANAVSKPVSLTYEDCLKQINDASRKKIQKYKSSQYKCQILKYFKLNELNKIFGINIQNVPDLNGVHQLEVRLTDEECLERYLQAEHFNTTNTKIITEANLRDYLYLNLDLIEIGLTPVGKEISTDEGRIDILAKDKTGKYVILELKTEIDKRLIWQCMYYPEVLPHKFPAHTPIRVITICPEYPEYLLIVLKKLPFVELFQYQIHSTNSRIEDIQISRLQKEGASRIHYHNKFSETPEMYWEIKWKLSIGMAQA